jgi:hypothetical protein
MMLAFVGLHFANVPRAYYLKISSMLWNCEVVAVDKKKRAKAARLFLLLQL